MTLCGLKPHTHADRAAIIEQLIPLWQQKFGDNLIAIAADASYARGRDIAYSDLELNVFLKTLPPEGEDRYLQRVVDGLLIEAIYHTPETFLKAQVGLTSDWYIAASDVLLPVYNAPFIANLERQIKAAQFPPEVFTHLAAQHRCEFQEAFAKVLNAVEQNNTEGVSLLLADAVLYLLRTLSPLNQQPFTTFARFIAESRTFKIKPARFDELLDILAQGRYQDLPHLGEVSLAVFESMEQLFVARGIRLYDDPLDPNLPNPRWEISHAELLTEENDLVRLVPVTKDNWRECIKLPTGEDHRHVAPNVYSIAETYIYPSFEICCVYAGELMVGFTMYGPDIEDNGRFWIGRMMIAEPHRGKGYGRAALVQILAKARRLGYPEVVLSTHPDNFKAIRLYESVGFRTDGIIDDGELVFVCPV